VWISMVSILLSEVIISKRELSYFPDPAPHFVSFRPTECRYGFRRDVSSQTARPVTVYGVRSFSSPRTSLQPRAVKAAGRGCRRAAR
jgi:hypothetical protein